MDYWKKIMEQNYFFFKNTSLAWSDFTEFSR